MFNGRINGNDKWRHKLKDGVVIYFKILLCLSPRDGLVFLSMRNFGFCPTLAHVGFVVDKVAVREF
jgi:hypothetical protein